MDVLTGGLCLGLVISYLPQVSLISSDTDLFQSSLYSSAPQNNSREVVGGVQPVVPIARKSLCRLRDVEHVRSLS